MMSVLPNPFIVRATASGRAGLSGVTVWAEAIVAKRSSATGVIGNSRMMKLHERAAWRVRAFSSLY
jgi:hypothetical protein